MRDFHRCVAEYSLELLHRSIYIPAIGTGPLSGINGEMK
jgi:hypothetical protein